MPELLKLDNTLNYYSNLTKKFTQFIALKIIEEKTSFEEAVDEYLFY